MALFIAPIIRKQTGTSIDTFTSTNYLLNTTKVQDFEKYKADTSQCSFFYSDTEGQCYRSTNYVTTLSRSQFKAKIREVTNEKFIEINFIEFDGRTGIDELKEINIDRIVLGKDITVNGRNGYSLLYIERGSFAPHIKCITTHTITEINHSSSGSVSLSMS